MDFQTLYNFTYSLTKLYDEATDRYALIEGFSKALSLFFPIEDLKIYLMDEYSYLLKDFEKPWESLSLNDDSEKIKSRFAKSFFYYIPYAVLSAMTFPAIFYSTGSVLSATVGVGVAMLLAFFHQSLIVVSVAASLAALFVSFL